MPIQITDPATPAHPTIIELSAKVQIQAPENRVYQFNVRVEYHGDSELDLKNAEAVFKWQACVHRITQMYGGHDPGWTPWPEE